jgi:hypothetical protein
MNLRVEKGFNAWIVMDGIRHFATVYGTEAEAKAFAAGYKLPSPAPAVRVVGLKGPIIDGSVLSQADEP